MTQEEKNKVLEILKNNIYNLEIHKRILSEPKGEPFIMISIHASGDESVELLKRWIKDANKLEK